MMTAVSKTGIKPGLKIPDGIKTFRIVASRENQSTPVDPRLMGHLEKIIGKAYKLSPNRSDPDLQFWFLTRSEGSGFFGARLTQHPDFGKVLAKGELRPEIADILCLLSQPQKTDVFLDPFAGSNAIARARANYPFTKIIAGDTNPKNQHIQKLDATKLDQFSNGSIDKIVTDPPWGFFGQKIDISDLYTQTLDSFHRVLKKDGRVVMLVGSRDFFEKLLQEFRHKFVLKQKLYVLISGKKAGIYHLHKK